MKILRFLMSRSRRTVLLALLVGVVGGGSNMALIALINAALRGGRPTANLIWGFVGLCITLPLAKFTAEVLLTGLGQGALLQLRLQLSRQIVAAPLRYLEEVGPHRLLAALVEDVPVVTNALLALPILCINVAVIAAGLVYMGWLSPPLLAFVLLFISLGVIIYQLPVVRAVRLLRQAREQSDALFNHFRTLIGGNKELKLHRACREQFLADVLAPTATNFCRQNVAGMRIYNAAASWGQILVFIAIGLLLFAAPSYKALSAQTLTGYSLTLLYLMAPLQAVMNSIPSLSRAGVAIDKIESLGLSLAAQATEPCTPWPSARQARWESLELIGVTHSYRSEEEDAPFVLGPVSLTLRPGELVFLTGGNGSGKTTLAKLLTGLYAPESGQIRLDHQRVTDENRDGYRQHFSAVFSDFHLFESLLGLDGPTLDERAREYLGRLQLDRKVSLKGGVLSTIELSQGQRKRLALLRAYLEDRPLYLFDEWAADQDPLFKKFFYVELLPELKAQGKTVLVITHDDQYYHLANRIIKLDYGKVTGDIAINPPQNAPAEVPVSL
jgi:putative ATP-binding cassette transporter